jgi:hypothetical protein
VSPDDREVVGMRARVRGGTARARTGLFWALAVVAVAVALGGGSARAGYFTGNTTGISSITGGGQTAALIGGTYYLFLPSNFGTGTVAVTAVAVSNSNYVAIGNDALTLAQDTNAGLAQDSGSVVSICKPGNAGTGDASNCDHFNLDVLPTSNFDTNLRALSMSPGPTRRRTRSRSPRATTTRRSRTSRSRPAPSRAYRPRHSPTTSPFRAARRR